MLSQRAISYKFVLLGSTGVGKTSIARSFNKEPFNYRYDNTIGVDFFSRQITLDIAAQPVVKIQLWDTAGQETFNSIVKAYYKTAIAALIVFDINSKETFLDAQYWVNTLRKNSCINPKHIILVGNKCEDNQQYRQVSAVEAQYFAQQEDLHSYIETSAKTDFNIKTTFQRLAQSVYFDFKDEDQPVTGISIRLLEPPNHNHYNNSLCNWLNRIFRLRS